MAWRKPTNLNDWLKIVARHKWKIVFTSIPVMIVVLIASHWFPREYAAVAKFQQELDAATDLSHSDTIQSSLRRIRDTMREKLRGRPAIEQLIYDLQLTRDFSYTTDRELTAAGQLAMHDLVDEIGDRIVVRQQQSSKQVDQIVVSYTDSDRELAPRIVNRLIENYIRTTRQELDQMLLNAKSFFETEVARYRAKVNELEGQKLKFELDNPGLLPEDPASVEAKLVALRSKLDHAAQQAAVLEQQRDDLTAWVGGQPEVYETKRRGQNPLLLELLKRRMRLQDELEKHLFEKGRTEEHPVVKKCRHRIENLESQIAQTDKEVEIGTELKPNTERLATVRQIKTAAAEIIALHRQREELTGQVEHFEIIKRNFFARRNEYTKLNRDLAEASNQLSFWEANLRRTMLALRAEVAQHGIRLGFIHRAPDLSRPSKPTMLSILAAAVVIGLTAGVGMIMLTEMLDHSYRGVEQAVDELKLPVLGAVSEIMTRAETHRRRAIEWAVFPSVGIAMAAVLVISFVITYLDLY